MLKVKRPLLITWVCVLGLLRYLVLFALIASPEIKKLGGIYPAVFGSITAAQFISMVGVWHMKKWGVHLFTAAFFIKLLVLVVINDLGIWTWVGVVFSVLYMTAFMWYYKQMDENL